MNIERISFSVFCKRVFPTGKKSGRRSAGQFVADMLSVCGCTNSILNDPNGIPKKLHSAVEGRIFSQEYRSMCKLIDFVKMKSFFIEIVETEDANRIAREFRVHFSGEVNRDALASALAHQLKTFIENEEKEDIVDDIVACEYEKILSAPEAPLQKRVITQPLYAGDDFRKMFQSSFEANCYEDVHVLLTVLNTGKRTWRDRKLVLKKGLCSSVEISNKEFDLEEVKANDKAEVRFNLRFRDEGTFSFIWQILDYNGDDCFPNKEDMLSFEVSVTYLPRKEEMPGVF